MVYILWHFVYICDAIEGGLFVLFAENSCSSVKKSMYLLQLAEII